MRRVDALIVGGGPSGMLTALLAKAQGSSVLVVEQRGREPLRTNLARFSGDTQEVVRSVGAGDALFPPYEPLRGPRPFVAPVNELERSLRGAAARRSVPVSYHSEVVDLVDAPRGGVQAAVRTLNGTFEVGAPVLIDASGGRFAGYLDESLLLRDAGGRGHAIGVHWTDGTPTAGWTDSRQAAAGELPALRLPIGDGRFTGHHDARRGTFGVIELPDEPDATRQRDLVRELGSSLGLTALPARSYDFPISNAIADRAWSGSIALVGDSVTHLRPRTGMGVNLGATDAIDAARLIDDVARLRQTGSATLDAMERQRVFEAFAGAVMGRHKAALHAEQMPSPFGG